MGETGDADTAENVGESEEIRNEVWAQIEDDLDDVIPGEFEARLFESDDDTIEVNVRPDGIGTELEARHDDITTTVHRTFSIVVSRE